MSKDNRNKPKESKEIIYIKQSYKERMFTSFLLFSGNMFALLLLFLLTFYYLFLYFISLTILLYIHLVAFSALRLQIWAKSYNQYHIIAFSSQSPVPSFCIFPKSATNTTSAF